MKFQLGILGLACLVSLTIGVIPGGDDSGLSIAYQWKYVDWTHGSVELTHKPFILGNSFPQDVDIDSRRRIFATTPQWLNGVPITLSLLTTAEGPGGPLLTPYPDWTWHTPNDCEKLVSVYRIAIDECDRLWMVDVGQVAGKSVCPEKIMIFDLATDTLLHKYVIPADQSLNGTASYVTPIVDVGYSCLDTHLYVADVAKYGLLIYDLRADRSWRLDNTPGNAFGPNANAEKVTIAGESFDLTDGTLGMSLSPPGFFKHRYLYFNSLASFYQKFTAVNSLKWSEVHEPVIFQSIEERASQAGAQATSKRGAIFFQLVQETAVACWNIENPFTADYIHVIDQDEVNLQYVSGIKVIVNDFGQEELWFNTNRLQKIINKDLTPTEVNFRFIHGLVDELIEGTVCEPQGLAGSCPDLYSWRRV